MSIDRLAASICGMGTLRDENNDRVLVEEANDLYAVADGMGSLECSGDAAEDALGHIADSCKELRRQLHAMQDEAVTGALRAMVNEANRDIVHRYKGTGGTTLTMALLYGGKMFYAHAGDSRIYVVRYPPGLAGQPSLQQVTHDDCHPELAEREDREYHELRHVITDYLGKGKGLDIETGVVPLHDADSVLLVTDGITKVLADVDISKAIGKRRTLPETYSYEHDPRLGVKLIEMGVLRPGKTLGIGMARLQDYAARRQVPIEDAYDALAGCDNYAAILRRLPCPGSVTAEWRL
jgi:serine/threonine protein phosphatase PrpC